jgi:UDP-N-acetyl-D-glucosamine dehydrogenase
MTHRELLERIDRKDACVAVLGLGYVGLPLALAFAEEGFDVVGLDVDPRKVEALQKGRSHVDDVKSEALRAQLDRKRFRASADFDELRRAHAIVVCVPTPLNKSGDPDISFIVNATLEIEKRLQPGQLVVLESTTYPGTTVEVVLPRLAGAQEKSLTVGKDFFLAFSPERIDPGSKSFTVRNTPKVVGGVTERCGAAARALYGSTLEKIVPVRDATTAEMVKILENTFRMVNIAMVNEVALLCERLGIDVWEVIDAAATKPFGFMPFYPGPGLGGHCIPVDPFYLSWKMRTLHAKARFIELAGEINSAMPEFIVNKVASGLNERGKAVRGARVLILGFAYKRDVSDVRESPAFDIATKLHERGADLSYHDPHAPEVEVEWGKLRSVALTAELCRRLDCAVIVTDHRAVDLDLVLEHAPLVVDSRNATKGRASKAQILRL